MECGREQANPFIQKARSVEWLVQDWIDLINEPQLREKPQFRRILIF